VARTSYLGQIAQRQKIQGRRLMPARQPRWGEAGPPEDMVEKRHTPTATSPPPLARQQPDPATPSLQQRVESPLARQELLVQPSSPLGLADPLVVAPVEAVGTSAPSSTEPAAAAAADRGVKEHVLTAKPVVDVLENRGSIEHTPIETTDTSTPSSTESAAVALAPRGAKERVLAT